MMLAELLKKQSAIDIIRELRTSYPDMTFEVNGDGRVVGAYKNCSTVLCVYRDGMKPNVAGFRKAVESFLAEDKQYEYQVACIKGYFEPFEATIYSYEGFLNDLIADEINKECDYEYYSPSCPWNAPGMSIADFI